MTNSQIIDAINNKEIIEFRYQGYTRIAEPHVYGIKNGKEQIEVYQIGGGSSSGGLPDWRRMDLDEVSSIKTTGQHFPGPRPYPSGKHSDWDRIIAVVK